MTADCRSESFGPYAFTLTPAEAEAAAARAGLRLALRGGLLARHLAPLTAFVLILVFASVLALTGLISRRAGEATLILAAAAFMIQRLTTRRRFFTARRASLAEIETVRAIGPLALSVDEAGVDVGEEALQGGTFDVAAGEAAVVVCLGQTGPAFMGLALDEGLGGLALGIKGVELLLQPGLGRLASVDRAADRRA